MLNISGGITGVLQGTSGNNEPKDIDLGDDLTDPNDDVRPGGATDNIDYSFTLDLNLESELATGHMFFFHIETGDGDGINDNFSTNIAPNYDPYNTHNVDVGHQDVTISQAFYEGTFLNEMLTVDIGKMDIHSFTDENNFAGDETTQFTASIFARLTGTLFAELDSYYAPGFRLLLTPAKWFELSYVAANSKNDKLGVKPFQAGQINVKPNIMGMEGNYRAYYIRDGREYTKIDYGTPSVNIGWGISFDQSIANNIGLFIRYGSQDDTIILVDDNMAKALSGGISVMGSVWNRENDFIGIGYGQITKKGKISTNYSGEQTVIEFFYHWQVLERLALTPDVQFHSNLPRTDKRDITVFGIRAQLDF